MSFILSDEGIMDMEKEKLFRYFNGLASEDEKRQIHEWYTASKVNEDQFYATKVEFIAKKFDENPKEVNPEEKWKKFQQRHTSKPLKPLRGFKPYHIARYAAAILLFSGLGYLLYRSVPTERKVTTEIPKGSITLQLGNGDIKVIKETGNTNIKDTKGHVVGKQMGSQLVYTSKNFPDDDKDVFLNTLTVPYAKRFHIVLADGSQVTLNAGSSITYPTSFHKEGIRQVFLKGEAYFSIKNDPDHPFVVNSEEMNIRVLGTEFNVSSYPEDEHINTTLVKGKVGLYQSQEKYDAGKSTILQPGQMAIWNKANKSITVGQADLRLQTAWINGRIIFKHTPFQNILKKLERHYDVHITNQNTAMENEYFTASFDEENIQQVLETFRQGYGMKYSIHGKEIRINP